MTIYYKLENLFFLLVMSVVIILYHYHNHEFLFILGLDI